MYPLCCSTADGAVIINISLKLKHWTQGTEHEWESREGKGLVWAQVPCIERICVRTGQVAVTGRLQRPYGQGKRVRGHSPCAQCLKAHSDRREGPNVVGFVPVLFLCKASVCVCVCDWSVPNCTERVITLARTCRACMHTTTFLFETLARVKSLHQLVSHSHPSDCCFLWPDHSQV